MMEHLRKTRYGGTCYCGYARSVCGHKDCGGDVLFGIAWRVHARAVNGDVIPMRGKAPSIRYFGALRVRS